MKEMTVKRDKERQREKKTVGFIERQKKTPVGLG